MAVVADALRRDVRLLGDLLGRVLVEQEGEQLLEDVERVRALARAARAGEPHEELRRAVEALPLERQTSVLRAFALYFQLANVAEQHHRVRRPRVVDEIRNGHWFFEQSLIDAAEQLLADFRRRVPGAAVPFRFGTWIGG